MRHLTCKIYVYSFATRLFLIIFFLTLTLTPLPPPSINYINVHKICLGKLENTYNTTYRRTIYIIMYFDDRIDV